MVTGSSVPARILVVDDTDEIRDLLATRLRAMGHDVELASSGEEGLERARATPPDLVLLDVMMPGVDGVGVLAALKQDSALRHVPVVMISADGDHAHVARCIGMGAEDYLAKPFNGLLLKARVTAALMRKRWHDHDVRQQQHLQFERDRAERLLWQVLPPPVADRYRRGEHIIADSIPSATILFADLVDFTGMSTVLDARSVVGLLSALFSEFDALVEQEGLYKVKTVGDAYMVAGNLPTPHVAHAPAVARLGLQMQAVMPLVPGADGRALQLRVGIHTGPVVAGVLGTQRLSYDVWGDTVNVASRMCTHAEPGHVQVSAATAALLTGEFRLRERGPVEVKGKGAMVTHIVEGPLRAA